MERPVKKHASAPSYISPKQLTIDGFVSPFAQQLDPTNRWVELSHLIPWDEICNLYLKHVKISTTGRPALNPRIVLGALIIKHLGNLDDRETVIQITENMYMQYFLGYRSFTTVPPFDASLFVEFRKRLGFNALNAINERIVLLKTQFESPSKKVEETKEPNQNTGTNPTIEQNNKGRLLIDATACPQDIAYPTDLDLLSTAREKSEFLIDKLYDVKLHKKKPRTYRETARKRYLQTAQKRNKSRKEIRKAVGRQLRFLRRNLKSINKLLDKYETIPLNAKNHKYLLVITTLYEQQNEMYIAHKHTVENRIVSIHQPHVRPIVRGKSQAKVEFGAKINVSLIDGISFLDHLNWNAFNEGSCLMDSVDKYYQRFGFYPREILADQIYCTRHNRKELKLKFIKLIAKPLGRPSAVKEHVRPGERNPIEGKFGQAKTAYGLGRIRARLQETSQSWIASIILVLNLVKLAGVAPLCQIFKLVQLSFSAIVFKKILIRYRIKIANEFFFVGNLSVSRAINYLGASEFFSRP